MADRKNLHGKNTDGYCDPRLTKILMAQYRIFTADPHPHLLCVIDKHNIRVWYFLVGGLDTPFLHGEYIFKLTASDDFPQKPPRFEFCTTNGVFQPGGPICISVGEFHAEDRPGKDGSHGWRASLGMKGFAIQVVNGLICYEGLESGIRIQNIPNPMKIAYAKSSRTRNQRDFPELYQLFEAVIASSPESEPVRNITNARLRLEGKTPPPRLPATPAVTTPAVAAPAVAAPAVAAPAVAAPAVAVPPRVDNLAASVAGDSLLDELLGEEEPVAVPEPTVAPAPAAAPAAAPAPVAPPVPAEDDLLVNLLNDEVGSSEDLTSSASHIAEIAVATAEPTVAEEDDSATLTQAPAAPTQATGPDQDDEMDSLISSLLDLDH